MVQSAINRGKKWYFRAYIGSGSDGSTEGRPAIDVKVEPKDTRVTYRAIWRDYAKTVWAKYAGVCPSLRTASQ